MRIECGSSHIKWSEIQKRITGMGCRISSEGTRRWYEENRELVFSLLAGLLLLVSLLSLVVSIVAWQS
jgi:hypothetical protein